MRRDSRRSRGAGRQRAGDSLAALTPREREVLGLLRKGQPNKVIAAQLGLSVRTVEAHRARIMEKMEVRSMGQLIELLVKAQPQG